MSEAIEVVTDSPNFKAMEKRVSRLQDGRGTKEDVKILREALKDCPTLWQAAGNMATITTARLIQDAAGENDFMKLSMTRGCAAIKERLGYDESPMLEQLLIEVVVLVWLRWGLVEYRYTNVVSKEHTLPIGDYWERKLSASQRRYLRALTTLARVRKLELSPMQINIADQQVNIAGRQE